jgi:predicted ATPase/DNA-binding SARP family transcriptional activator
MLGPMEVVAEDGPLVLGGPRQVALLAYLLVHRNARVSTDELADAVWPGEAADGAAKRAQVAVARLRRSIAPVADRAHVETLSGGYRLRVAATDVDADVFAARVEEGRGALDAGEPQRAATALREALALWRGAALADVMDADFARMEAAVLDDLRLRAVELRVDADLRLGRHRELLGELEALAASHPERESLVGALMVALYRSGRQADALDAYRRARRHLSGELGLEPGPALRALQARILAHDETLDPGPPAAAPAAEPAGGDRGARRLLPPRPAPLVGREHDVAAVVGLLHDPDVRLVTLLGPGGVGKTSVARAVAERLAHGLADLPVFVDLTAARSADEVAGVVLDAIGAPASTGPEAAERLLAALAAGDHLVVLDNFEHVLDAAALVADVVGGAPGLRLLVTSRVALGLRAERRYPVAPLALPGGDAAGIGGVASVELFVARARDRDPSFRLTTDNAAAVAEICRRAGGLPLAIELAAARVAALAPTEIAARLRRGALDVAADVRDAPERQLSLRATMDWSVALLAPDERAAFAAFAVFAGGAPPDTAEDVLPTGLDVLERLLAHSLLTRRDTPAGSRLVMLEPVREYAAELFESRPDREAVRRRHAEAFLALAEAGRARLEGPDWVGWRDRLEADLENLRAALDWAVAAPSPPLALALAAAVREFLTLRGRAPEAHRRLTAALDVARDADAAQRARALVERSRAEWDEIAVEDAEADARAALELYRGLGDPGGMADALMSLAIRAAQLHRNDRARDLRAEAGRLWRAAGRAEPLMTIVFDASFSPDADEAARRARAAVTELRRTGAVRGISLVLSNAALMAIEHGRYALALPLLADALDVARAANDEPMVAWILGDEGFAAIGLGDDDRAERALLEELHICRRLGYLELMPEGVLGLACVAAGRGQTSHAALLAGAAHAAFRRRPILPGGERLLAWIEAERLGPARAQDPDTWDAAAARGAQLTDAEALEAALSSAAG